MLNSIPLTKNWQRITLKPEDLPNCDLPTLLVWVDVICINQSDVSEKDHQVQLMKSVASAIALGTLQACVLCSHNYSRADHLYQELVPP